MVGYVIVCDISQNLLSHDWGTEFYHEKRDAEGRAEQLNEICSGNFTVQKVGLIAR